LLIRNRFDNFTGIYEAILAPTLFDQILTNQTQPSKRQRFRLVFSLTYQLFLWITLIFVLYIDDAGATAMPVKTNSDT